MKCVIIYYSQTGNTKKVARAIHKGIAPLVSRCDLIPVRQMRFEDLADYELVGLGSPVWMGAEPPNVRRFIDHLPRQYGKHLFSFNTHGVLPELYFPAVLRRLKVKGFTAIGMRDWYGTARFQLAPSPYYTDGHPDEIDLKAAEAFGAEMVELSRKISAGHPELIPPLPDQVLTPQLLVINEFYQSGHNPHGRLQYNPDKCLYPKCRLCIDHCLMDYIDFSVTPRLFGSEKNGCDMWMGCTFCELICPTGAISGNWEEVLQRESSAQVLDYNLLERAAEEAESAGRLRRLVPREEVRWDRPYFSVHAQRPRFKIPKDE